MTYCHSVSFQNKVSQWKFAWLVSTKFEFARLSAVTTVTRVHKWSFRDIASRSLYDVRVPPSHRRPTQPNLAGVWNTHRWKDGEWDWSRRNRQKEAPLGSVYAWRIMGWRRPGRQSSTRETAVFENSDGRIVHYSCLSVYANHLAGGWSPRVWFWERSLWQYRKWKLTRQ